MSFAHYTTTPLSLKTLIDFSQDQETAMKPRGLWVSDDSDFGWQDWQREADFQHQPYGELLRYTVSLKPDAKILWVTTPREIQLLSMTWKNRIGEILWREVAKNSDGIIITPYQWSMRNDFGSCWYYGWDCASGCIWNPRAISSIRQTEMLKRHVQQMETA